MANYTNNKKSIGLKGGPNEYITHISDLFSVEGYKADSPDVNNPYNIIQSGDITMEGVDFPVMGTDNLGNEQMMMPGMNYQFPGDQVFEVPMAQVGNETKPGVKDLLNTLSGLEGQWNPELYKRTGMGYDQSPHFPSVQPLLDATGNTYAEDAVQRSYDFSNKWLDSPRNRKLLHDALLDSGTDLGPLKEMGFLNWKEGESAVDRIINWKRLVSDRNPLNVQTNQTDILRGEFNVPGLDLQQPWRPDDDNVYTRSGVAGVVRPLGAHGKGSAGIFNRNAPSDRWNIPYIMGLPESYQKTSRSGSVSLHEDPTQLGQTAMHERGHQQDIPGANIKSNIVNKTSRLNKKAGFGDANGDYLAQPTETAARIGVIRKHLYDAGIDIFNNPVDFSQLQEELNDLRYSTFGRNALIDLRQIYSDEDIEMLLNKLPAKNGREIKEKQVGGSLPKFQVKGETTRQDSLDIYNKSEAHLQGYLDDDYEIIHNEPLEKTETFTTWIDKEIPDLPDEVWAELKGLWSTFWDKLTNPEIEENTWTNEEHSAYAHERDGLLEVFNNRARAIQEEYGLEDPPKFDPVRKREPSTYNGDEYIPGKTTVIDHKPGPASRQGIPQTFDVGTRHTPFGNHTVQDIDEYRYLQGDLQDNVVNPDMPMGYYDRRIEPMNRIELKKMVPDSTGAMVTDFVTLNSYNSLDKALGLPIDPNQMFSSSGTNNVLTKHAAPVLADFTNSIEPLEPRGIPTIDIERPEGLMESTTTIPTSRRKTTLGYQLKAGKYGQTPTHHNVWDEKSKSWKRRDLEPEEIEYYKKQNLPKKKQIINASFKTGGGLPKYQDKGETPSEFYRPLDKS